MPHGFSIMDFAEALSDRLEEVSFTPGSSDGNVKLRQPQAFQKAADSASDARVKPFLVEPVVYIFDAGQKDTINLDGGRGVGIRRSLHDVRIRAPQNDPVEGRLLAQRIHEVMDHKPPDGYCECFTTAGPVDIGNSPDSFPEWSIPGWDCLRDIVPRPMGWGPGTPASGASQPFLEALANQVVEDLRFRTVAFTIAAGQSGYFFYPADRSPAQILTRLQPTPAAPKPPFVDGLWTEVTSALAFETDLGPDVYRVYETVNEGLGAITIKVR